MERKVGQKDTVFADRVQEVAAEGIKRVRPEHGIVMPEPLLQVDALVLFETLDATRIGLNSSPFAI